VSEAKVRILTRGDDSGSCHAANLAIRDAARQGVLRNTSLMVPAPAFEEATEMLPEVEGLCIGIHGCLTDEWNEDRWGPVLGADKVPSLVRDDGTFFQDTRELWAHKPDNGEIVAELRAQLNLARSRGVDAKYMDSHMAYSWFDGLEECLQKLADEEGIICHLSTHPFVQGLPKVEGEFADPVERHLAALAQVEPGTTYIHVTHPGYAEGDMAQMTYGDNAPGVIAKQRNWDRLMFMDPRVVAFYKEHDIEPIHYTDLKLD
jgi:predicted glycoside hydrolase/deacetylase ChbG (UPF0249 family)